MNVFARKPRRPTISAPPTIFCSVVMLWPPTRVRDLDPEQRQRRRADEHPEREARVHRAEHPVAHRPERLEDRPVEDVGPDRDLGVEAEEQDQDRRHQAAAAHPGHPDEHPDARPASEYCQVTRGSGEAGRK